MMNGERKRFFVPLVILGAVILTVGVWFATHTYRQHQNGHDTQYYDKYSHQTVSTIKGKSPETYGTDNSGPLFLGFQTLIDHGFTQDQLSDVKTGITNYITQNKLVVKNVSFDIDSFKRLGTESSGTGQNEVSFTVVFNYQDMYSADVTADGLTFVTLKLRSPDGKQLFDYASNPDLEGPSGQ